MTSSYIVLAVLIVTVSLSLEILNCFSKYLDHMAFLHTVSECSICFISSQTFHKVNNSNPGHFNRYVEVSCCNLDKHLSKGKKAEQFYIFFAECLQIFCPLKTLFCLCIIEFWEFFIYSESRVISDTYSAKIFYKFP